MVPKDADFEEFLTMLIEATGKVETRYFEVQTTSKHGPEVVHRERVYCYELYHQLRNDIHLNSRYTLMGELDKRSHEILASTVGEVVPDFVFHDPGAMTANLVVIEVKYIGTNKDEDICTDLDKLRKFVDEEAGKYKGAIYLVFGTGERGIAKFQKIAAQKLAGLKNGVFVLLWHKHAGKCAEEVWRLPANSKSRRFSMPDVPCRCTDDDCGHPNAEPCRKPISVRLKASIMLETSKFTESETGICEECWERIKGKYGFGN
jgi:hypothetical protein